MSKASLYSRRIVFLSFADTSFMPSLKRIRKQAKSMDVFTDIYIKTQNGLPLYAKKRIKEVIERTQYGRGYGYWTWKPAIILQTLGNLKEGDILFYADAGTHLNKNGRKKLLMYFESAIENDIWITQLGENATDIKFTKQDTIDYYLSSGGERATLNTGQLQATIIILVKNAYTCKLIQTWDELMGIDYLHYYDDSASCVPENPDFVSNRHDQSILSLLLKKNHFHAESVSVAYSANEEGWKQLYKDEPILIKRDLQKKIGIKRRVKLTLKHLLGGVIWHK